MTASFELKLNEQGIAQLIFDLLQEKVNKFSPAVLDELEKIVDGLKDRGEIKLLVIESGKEDSFIAGADLRSFESLFNDAPLAKKIIYTGHRLFSKIAALPFPTLAYIHGACLGGGLELALSCTYRVVSDASKTVLGLPEVSLGIIPGWGGTQRLPRLIGLLAASDLILTGKPVKAPKALKIGLADALIAHEFKEEKLAQFIALVLTKQGGQKIVEQRKKGGIKKLLLETNPLGRAFVFTQSKKMVLQKTKGHYPAPLLALEVLKNTANLPLEKGLEIEADTILNHLNTAGPLAKNLISLFFTQEALKKDKGLLEVNELKTNEIKGREVKTTSVIGAGIMGSGISWLLTRYDHAVRLKDIDLTAIGKGYSAIEILYNEAVKRKQLKPNEANLKLQKLSTTTDYTGFHHLDLVIEAATENLGLKQKIYADLEAVLPEKAVIASNTSSLSITEMAKSLKYPERFIGMHFFNPVHRMPLIEVIRGRQTSVETIVTVVELCKKLGKTPIVVEDCAGFLVNRIFALGANEVMYLFEEGISAKRLDQMMLNFGFPMAPFVLADEIGNDVLYKVNKVLEEAYGARMKGPQIFEKLYEQKLWGKKVNRGFYIYTGKQKEFNPEILKLVEQKEPLALSEIEMSDRVLLPMINEGARCLQENIVSRPDYLDMALILGVGFPPFRGGLMRYADSLGINYIIDHLRLFEQKYHMPRFTPCDYLLTMQKENKKFYAK